MPLLSSNLIHYKDNLQSRKKPIFLDFADLGANKEEQIAAIENSKPFQQGRTSAVQLQKKIGQPLAKTFETVRRQALPVIAKTYTGIQNWNESNVEKLSNTLGVPYHAPGTPKREEMDRISNMAIGSVGGWKNVGNEVPKAFK